MWTLWLVAAVASTTAEQVPDPRAHDSWISDMADVIEAPDEAALDARLQALHDELGVEIGVVTVQDTLATPKQFTTTLFNRWGIGDPTRDTGLLVVLVMGQRRLEMETGYGLEGVLPDGWLGMMQRDHMVPRFKQGAFADGLVAGLEQVDARLRAHPFDVRQGRQRPALTQAPEPVPPPTVLHPAVTGIAAMPAGVVWGLVMGGLLLAGWITFIVVRARRRRRCPTCQIDMPLLDEVADDAHLEPGQRTEELIGSVDWQVRVCTDCAFVRIYPKTAWFSGYSRCPACDHRTLSTSTTTEVSPTYSSSGRARVDEDCQHCPHRRTYTRPLPRKQRPSSSSSSSGGFSSGGSSSGGSWGGGSSGGGGAGSSW